MHSISSRPWLTAPADATVWAAELFFSGSVATVFRGGRCVAPAPEDGCAVRPRVRETMRGSEGPQFFDGLLGLVVTIKRVLEGFDGLLQKIGVRSPFVL